MNNPEYIPVDEFGLIAAEVKTELALPALNYQFGYIKELNETLKQYSQNPTDAVVKYPLIWVEQPFTIIRGTTASFYGRIQSVRVFIIAETDKTKKAKARMDDIFKTTIYPIRRSFLNQLDISVAFHTHGVDRIDLTIKDIYYWGEAQKTVLNDAVDCEIVTLNNLLIANNQNCSNFNSSII